MLLICVISIRNKDGIFIRATPSLFSVFMTIFARFLKIEKKIIQQLAIGAFFTRHREN